MDEFEKNQEYEDKVTREVARVTYFYHLAGDLWRCKICSRLIKGHYSGRPLNERMLDHFDNHIKRGEVPKKPVDKYSLD